MKLKSSQLVEAIDPWDPSIPLLLDIDSGRVSSIGIDFGMTSTGVAWPEGNWIDEPSTNPDLSNPYHGIADDIEPSLLNLDESTFLSMTIPTLEPGALVAPVQSTDTRYPVVSTSSYLSAPASLLTSFTGAPGLLLPPDANEKWLSPSESSVAHPTASRPVRNGGYRISRPGTGLSRSRVSKSRGAPAR